MSCPPYIANPSQVDIITLGTLLEAAGVPHGSLDSPLNPTTINGAYTALQAAAWICLIPHAHVAPSPSLSILCAPTRCPRFPVSAVAVVDLSVTPPRSKRWYLRDPAALWDLDAAEH
jgi:hypothetical protein